MKLEISMKESKPKIDRSICPICLWVGSNYTKPKCPKCSNLVEGENQVNALYEMYKKLYERFQETYESIRDNKN